MAVMAMTFIHKKVLFRKDHGKNWILADVTIPRHQLIFYQLQSAVHYSIFFWTSVLANSSLGFEPEACSQNKSGLFSCPAVLSF